MNEGKEFLIQGHSVHASVIQKEAAGEKTETSLLLIHAEDQLMSAEMTELLANTIIRQAKKSMSFLPCARKELMTQIKEKLIQLR